MELAIDRARAAVDRLMCEQPELPRWSRRCLVEMWMAGSADGYKEGAEMVSAIWHNRRYPEGQAANVRAPGFTENECDLGAAQAAEDRRSA